MEEKEKLILSEKEKIPEKKSSTTTLVLEKEEKTEEKKDKTKINLQTLRNELSKEKEMKEKMIKEEKAVSKPNYDLIKEISPEKRKKIYKIEKIRPQENPKPIKFNKKLKIILFSIIFFTAGLFCVTSGVELANAANTLSTAESVYEVKVLDLMKKISKIDNSNTALELIETYPEEIRDPATIAKSSNWFNNFCDFISGLFGG